MNCHLISDFCYNNCYYTCFQTSRCFKHEIYIYKEKKIFSETHCRGKVPFTSKL